MTLDAGHLGEVRAQRVPDVVRGPADRRDRADRARRGRAVVVAHDHDGVGATLGGRRLDRVVADPAGRVERELVALGDRVQRRPHLANEQRELVRIARRDRLEVEVDAVGASIAHGGRDLAGEVGASGRAPEQLLLAGQAGRRPGEALDGQDDPGAAGMGRVDDARHLRAGPAAPADRRRPIAVLLDQVALAVGPDTEERDGRDLLPVERRRAVAQLPVRQEAEDLTAQGARVDRGRQLERGRAFIGRPDGPVGRHDRGRVDDRRVRTRSGRVRRLGRSIGGIPQSLAGRGTRGQRTRLSPIDLPRIAGPGPERDGHPTARRERDVVVGVRDGLLVLDRRLEATGTRCRR